MKRLVAMATAALFLAPAAGTPRWALAGAVAAGLAAAALAARRARRRPMH